jgi:Flp pilus assembly pilin Flp
MHLCKLWIESFWKDEEGLGTLEILLILAVLVAIAIVFRKWIISWVNSLFTETNGELNQVNIDNLIEPAAE